MIMSKPKKNLMQKFVLMFGFGVAFTLLMAIQKIFVSSLIYLVLVFLELVGVYFIIKKFMKDTQC